METGIFRGVAMRDYHAFEAVNARLLATIVERCPAAAFFESWLNPNRPPEESSSTMDAGSIAHGILLEGGCDRLALINPMDHPAEKTGAIPEGWTNKSIRAARDAAYAAGKIPILKHAFAEVEAMVEAAKEFIATLDVEEPAIFRAFQPDGGESEVSMIWDDDGVPCRIRPDRISLSNDLIIDYKTGDTSAEPNTWGRSQMIRMGYYTAASFYRRGVRALTGKNPEYVFLVQEKNPPYLCSLVGVDEAGFALGASKIDYGLALWRKCAKARVWPTYPGRVLYPEIPTWESARWEEFEALGIPYDPAKLWQKPAPMRESDPL